jgi:hypothetical protein
LRIPHTLIRRLGLLGLVVAMTALVAACGGGGDDGGGSSSGGGSNNGNGGGSSAPSGPATSTAANTAVITSGIGIGGGASRVVNIPTVSVTVCAPGTSNCQTVNNVLVDTASYGLRLVSGALTSGVLNALPVSTVGGAPLAECETFVSSYTWGSVRTVDLKISGEQASSLPVQILGDLGTSNVPSSCTGSGTAADGTSDLGANGILGIGPAPYDCGQGCVTNASGGGYYACPNGNTSCTETTVPLAQQVANPVQRFATDNNGVIVQMSQVSASGQASATGLLTFGIGTQADNALGASTVLPSATTGDVAGTFLGKSVTAFFDTGSNAYFFDDASESACGSYPSFYCPSSPPVGYTATLTGANNAQDTVSLSIASANTLFSNQSYGAFNDLGGPFNGTGQWLDLGMPHFYGKTIYFGMDLTASGGKAPYVAF